MNREELQVVFPSFIVESARHSDGSFVVKGEGQECEMGAWCIRTVFLLFVGSSFDPVEGAIIPSEQTVLHLCASKEFMYVFEHVEDHITRAIQILEREGVQPGNILPWGARVILAAFLEVMERMRSYGAPYMKEIFNDDDGGLEEGMNEIRRVLDQGVWPHL